MTTAFGAGPSIAPARNRSSVSSPSRSATVIDRGGPPRRQAIVLSSTSGAGEAKRAPDGAACRTIAGHVHRDRLRQRTHPRVLEFGHHGLRVVFERLESRQHRRRFVVAVQASQGEERAVVGAAKQRLQSRGAAMPFEGLGRSVVRGAVVPRNTPRTRPADRRRPRAVSSGTASASRPSCTRSRPSV